MCSFRSLPALEKAGSTKFFRATRHIVIFGDEVNNFTISRDALIVFYMGNRVIFFGHITSNFFKRITSSIGSTVRGKVRDGSPAHFKTSFWVSPDFIESIRSIMITAIDGFEEAFIREVKIEEADMVMGTTTPRMVVSTGAFKFMFIAEEAGFTIFSTVEIANAFAIFFSEAFEEAGNFRFFTTFERVRVFTSSEIIVIKGKGKPAVIPVKGGFMHAAYRPFARFSKATANATTARSLKVRVRRITEFRMIFK